MLRILFLLCLIPSISSAVTWRLEINDIYEDGVEAHPAYLILIYKIDPMNLSDKPDGIFRFYKMVKDGKTESSMINFKADGNKDYAEKFYQYLDKNNLDNFYEDAFSKEITRKRTFYKPVRFPNHFICSGYKVDSVSRYEKISSGITKPYKVKVTEYYFSK